MAQEREYAAEEVSRHRFPGDTWLVLHGQVYDTSHFVKEHPGGEEVLLNLAGKDGTKCFDEIGHSQEAVQLKDTLRIGRLKGEMTSGEDVASCSGSAAAPPPEPSLDNDRDDDDDWTYEEAKKEDPGRLWLFIGLGVLAYAVLFYYLFR